MDEKKEKKHLLKKILLVIVMIIVALGVFIYFMQNSKIDNGFIFENRNAAVNNDTTNEQLKLDDSLVNSLYNYVEKTPVDDGDYYVEDTFYVSGKTELSNLSDEVKILTVFQNLTVEDSEEVDASDYTNKIILPEDMQKINVYSKEIFDNKLKEIFGKDATVNYKKVEGCSVNIDYLEDKKAFAQYVFPGGGYGAYTTGTSSLYKAEKVGNEIYLYDKYVYRVFENDKINYYTACDKKEFLGSIEGGIAENIDVLIQKYDSKIKSYKHTFSKDENGEYHWVSTEQI